MRNAILSSASTQLYNFGNNEIQLPNLENSMQNDSLVTNVHRNSFSMDSKICKDQDNQLRSGGGAFSVSYHSLFNYQQGGFQSFSTSCDDIISHQSFLLDQKRPLPQFDLDFQSLQNAIEVNDYLPQESITEVVQSQSTSNACKRTQNKRMKTSSGEDKKWLHDDHHHHQIKDPSSTTIQEKRVPVRRSQKLSDKITALQKLVSPYGKTDTASVLQEANLYIKLLQEQIQNLFQIHSSSYSSATTIRSQEMGEGNTDLKSRGLCLVPISATQKLTKNEDLLIDSNYISRKPAMH